MRNCNRAAARNTSIMNAMRALLVSFALASVVQAAEQKITPSHGATGDQFGYSVAISGDTLVAGSLQDFVGANVEQGSATVFTRSNNVWIEQAALIASDGAERDSFGFSVAIDQNTIVVGAFKDDIGANDGQGSVYVFVRNGTGWTQQAKLTASDGDAGDAFGYSVALDGDTLVAGAVGRDQNIYAAYGAAYVFVRNGNTWSQQARLVHADGWTSDNFGQDVAIDGHTVVVSSGFADIDSSLNHGAAWVFVRNGSSWSQQARILASDAAEFDEFGRSVDIDGDRILIGSLADEYRGAAYIFERTGTLWREQARLVAADAAPNDRFGIAVALEGDVAAIGSFGDDFGDRQGQGSVRVFARRDGAWQARATRTAFDADTFDTLGYSVAISGNDIAAGAYGDDVGSQLDQGSVYVFNADAVPKRRRAARK